ncbi:MAG: hypothetical protein K2O17_07450, partial [Bacteroidaceae bacterium]|nr:hypothetical protein [Bacteroidaceae bacterium]
GCKGITTFSSHQIFSTLFYEKSQKISKIAPKTANTWGKTSQNIAKAKEKQSRISIQNAKGRL